MAHRIQRRRFLQMVAAGGATALSTPASRVFAAGSDTVTIGWPNDVPTWDPNQRFTPDAQPIFKAVFDQPLDQDPQLKLVPHLIKSWELAADGLSMPVELRDDVVFHNGDKMTTEDFRYTFFERIKSGTKLDTANSWRKVQDIEIQSPTKAMMKFNSPAPTAPQWLAFLGSYIVPKKYIEAVGARCLRARSRSAPVPTSSSDYELNSRIVLERNDNYWGPKPKIARVTIQIIKDPSARVAAIQSGQVDCTINLPVREVQRFAEGSRACRRAQSDHPRRSCCRCATISPSRTTTCGSPRITRSTRRRCRRRSTAAPRCRCRSSRRPARRPISTTISSNTIRNSPSSCWRNRASVRTSRSKIGFASTNGQFPERLRHCARHRADVEAGRHRRQSRGRSNTPSISSSTAAPSCRRRRSTAGTTPPATRRSSSAICSIRRCRSRPGRTWTVGQKVLDLFNVADYQTAHRRLQRPQPVRGRDRRDHAAAAERADAGAQEEPGLHEVRQRLGAAAVDGAGADAHRRLRAAATTAPSY